MPGGGIEPPCSFWELRILSPLRLPISPSRHFDYSNEVAVTREKPTNWDHSVSPAVPGASLLIVPMVFI